MDGCSGVNNVIFLEEYMLTHFTLKIKVGFSVYIVIKI